MAENGDVVVNTKAVAPAVCHLPQHQRIALLTDGYSTPFMAKTAISLLRYRPGDMVAVIEGQASAETADQLFKTGGDIPVYPGLDEAGELDAVYIGIAPPGGKLPDAWRPVLRHAIQRGLDIVSGLHDFLSEDREYVALAERHGSRLIDVRKNRFKSTATGRKFRSGNFRVHTVGHDCSVGKMVVTLELQRALDQLGRDAKFLATGQTGIMIEGSGVPIDCVIGDFVNGAAEELAVQHELHDFLLIEGQGSISHPAFSAVTTGLLHGCAPDALIYCYEAERRLVKGLNDVPIPPLKKQLDALETLANLRHPCQTIGIAVNTRSLSDQLAREEIDRAEAEFGLPACDVYRHGADKLVTATLACAKRLESEHDR